MDFKVDIIWRRVESKYCAHSGIYYFTYVNECVESALNDRAIPPIIKYRQNIHYSCLENLPDSNMHVKKYAMRIMSLRCRNCGIITRYYELPV